MIAPRTYGHGLNVRKEDPARCIESVSDGDGLRWHQCSRKRGHGPDGLYCKQHDPLVAAAKRAAADEADRLQRERVAHRRKATEDAIEFVRDAARGGDERACSIIGRLES